MHGGGCRVIPSGLGGIRDVCCIMGTLGIHGWGWRDPLWGFLGDKWGEWCIKGMLGMRGWGCKDPPPTSAFGEV